MSDINRMMEALRNADAAGDTAAATRIASMIRAQQAAQMDPTDLSVAQYKNDALGEYLRNQAMQPREGESQRDRNVRLGGQITGSRPGQGETAARGYLQGGTLNWGDELIAGLGTIGEGQGSGTYGTPYEQAVAFERGRLAQGRKDYPVTAYGSEIVGALASPVNPALDKAMAAPSLLGKVVRGAVVGTGTGAIAGGGAANSMGDIPQSVALGSVIGGGMGAVAPVLIQLGSSAINNLLSRLPFRQKEAAARRIAQAMKDDGLTPEQAVEKVKQLGPEAALMDVGENLQGQARAVHSIPGEGRTKISNFLSARQEGVRGENVLPEGGQYQRAGRIVDDLVPDQYGQAKADVVANRKTLGGAYEAAKSTDDIVNIRPMLDDLDAAIPKAKGGIRSGLEKIRSYLLDNDGNPEVTIDALHQAKMAIDDLMSGEARTSMGSVSKAKIRNYQDQLIDAIERSGDAGASYRTGRLGTAGQWRIDEAIDSGVNFMRKSEFRDADELWSALSKMKPEEQTAFKTGIAQWMREQMAGTKYTANAVKNLIGRPDIERKLKAVFSDDELRKFINAIEGEGQMYGTYARVRGGSPTARIQAEQEGIMRDPGQLAQGARDIVSGELARMLRGGANIAGGLMDRAALPPGVSRRMADILTSPGELNALQQGALKMQLSNEAKGRLARRLMMGSVAGGM